MSKIAVIGSGISGLVAAHVLSKQHEVHLFESATRLGGHTATIDVETASGSYAIDTGFIVFNDWTYPNFIELLNQLGVKWQDSDMGFSVKSEKTGIEYSGRNFNTLFAQRKNLFKPAYHRMLLDIVRFNREALQLLNTPAGYTPTLGEYLKENAYSSLFIDHYIIPMGAAIWSANQKQMWEFPARFFVQFFKNHGMLSVNQRPTWRVIQKGSRSYIDPLTQRFQTRIHLKAQVTHLERVDEQIKITFEGSGYQFFDQVVVATHSDQALKLLKNPTSAEQEILGGMKYQSNDTILHTDSSVLPRNRKTWSAWNYWIPKKDQDRVALTYHMNILQGIRSPEDFLVSLNMSQQIDPAKIIRRFNYDHPVFTQETVRLQKRWNEISGVAQKIHFCGAYWGYGFHEDGVKSALNVANSFGISL